MTAREARRKAEQMLLNHHIPDSRQEADRLLTHITGRRLREGSFVLSAEQETQFFALVVRRGAGEPLQYLLGRWPFMQRELEVGPGVLIPRQDTETLCESAIALAKESGEQRGRALDLGSGTGAIALALYDALPGWDITALENSSEALAYLRRNTVGTSVEVVEEDLFQYQKQLPPSAFHMILSNPPYLTTHEMQHLQTEIAYEPAAALQGGEDGLLYYSHIIPAYSVALKEGGWLGFEIGETQGPAVEQLFRQTGYNDICSLQDLSGNTRCVFGRKTKTTK